MFELRSLDAETGRILGSTPIDDEAGALAAFEVSCRYATENGGAFELVKDGVRVSYFCGGTDD